MKRIFTWLLAIAISASSCFAKSLRVNARNLGKDTEVTFNRTYRGAYANDFRPLEFGSDSIAVINVDDSDVERVSLVVKPAHGQNKALHLYLTDELTEIAIDPESENCFRFLRGVNPETVAAVESTRECYDTFYFDYLGRTGDRFGVRNDSVAESVKSKFVNYGDSIASRLNNIPEPLRSVLRQDMALSVLRLWHEVTARKTGAEWKSAGKSLEEWAGIDNPYNSLSHHFPNAASHHISESMLKRYSVQEMRHMDRGRVLRLVYDCYKNEFTGRNRETLLADLIHQDVEKSRFSTGLDSLAADFCKEYPMSGFLSLLDKDMEEFHRANSALDRQDIVFIDTAEVPTLDSLIARFKGHPVLVDVWATWCGPCRESFTKIKPLQEYAREHGIELVYISIDRPQQAQLAKKLAAYYNLSGHHVVVSEKLDKEVRDNYGKGNGLIVIPCSALYDREGRLVKKHISSDSVNAVIDELKAAGL